VRSFCLEQCPFAGPFVGTAQLFLGQLEKFIMRPQPTVAKDVEAKIARGLD